MHAETKDAHILLHPTMILPIHKKNKSEIAIKLLSYAQNINAIFIKKIIIRKYSLIAKNGMFRNKIV